MKDLKKELLKIYEETTKKLEKMIEMRKEMKEMEKRLVKMHREMNSEEEGSRSIKSGMKFLEEDLGMNPKEIEASYKKGKEAVDEIFKNPGKKKKI